MIKILPLTCLVAVSTWIFTFRSTSPAESYYAEKDFAQVKKYDVHIHIESNGNILMEQAKKDNFRLLDIMGDWEPFTVAEQQQFALRAVNAYPQHVAYASSFDVKDWKNPAWSSRTAQWLEQTFRQGAVGVKVWKNIGMELKDERGKFVMIDHPRFDTIFRLIQKHNKTLLTHQGEPRNCWLPLDSMTVKGDRNYFAQHPQYHMYLHPEYPSYQEQIDARDRMIAKNPDLRIVSVHLASLEWNVDEIAKRLDRFPNLAVDMAARIEHLQLAAANNRKKVRDFFIKYQDRILYGTDIMQDSSSTDAMFSAIHDRWISDWNFLATGQSLTNGDGVSYQGLQLPRQVIDKVYAKNAEKWIPELTKP